MKTSSIAVLASALSLATVSSAGMNVSRGYLPNSGNLKVSISGGSFARSGPNHVGLNKSLVVQDFAETLKPSADKKALTRPVLQDVVADIDKDEAKGSVNVSNRLNALYDDMASKKEASVVSGRTSDGTRLEKGPFSSKVARISLAAAALLPTQAMAQNGSWWVDTGSGILAFLLLIGALVVINGLDDGRGYVASSLRRNKEKLLAIPGAVAVTAYQQAPQKRWFGGQWVLRVHFNNLETMAETIVPDEADTHDSDIYVKVVKTLEKPE